MFKDALLEVATIPGQISDDDAERYVKDRTPLLEPGYLDNHAMYMGDDITLFDEQSLHRKPYKD